MMIDLPIVARWAGSIERTTSGGEEDSGCAVPADREQAGKRATIARWQAFWRDHIPQTSFWKVARARLIPVVDVALLPLSLLDAFLRTKDPFQGWGHLLRFLSPLTIPGSPVIEIM
jgi:hypothetical protein